MDSFLQTGFAVSLLSLSYSSCLLAFCCSQVAFSPLSLSLSLSRSEVQLAFWRNSQVAFCCYLFSLIRGELFCPLSVEEQPGGGEE
jgi:hypothetical protein